MQRAGAPLRCGVWASDCGGFSCCGAWALGTRASVVVAHRLSCSAACGIFPAQGSNPCPCIGRRILIHCATREVLIEYFYLFIYLFIYKNYLIYLFLAALGLHCCTQAFSSCSEPGLLFVVVRGLPIVVASLVVEHGL